MQTRHARLSTPTLPVSEHSAAIASVLGGALCLSMSAVIVKLAGVDAPTTAVLRCALALLLLIPLAYIERVRHGRSEGNLWAGIAGIALGVDYVAWTAAIYDVGAGISTVLVNVQVVVLPLLGLVVDRERIPGRFLLALPLMFVGITLVGGVWTATVQSGSVLRGTVLGLVAGTAYGVYLFFTRRAGARATSRGHPRSTVRHLSWATTTAALTAVLLAPLTGGINLAGIEARSWMYLALLAIVGQVIAWFLIHHGSAQLSASTSASLLLVQPVLALAFSAWILAEYPDLLQLIGAGLVVLSVAVATLNHDRVRLRTRRLDSSRRLRASSPGIS